MPVLYLIINLSSAAPVLISVPSGACGLSATRAAGDGLTRDRVDELRLRTKGVAEKKDGTSVTFQCSGPLRTTGSIHLFRACNC